MTPTPAQAAAGNYKKTHTRLHGLAIAIETPKGGTRRGGHAGREWECKVPYHYGYIKGHFGADGDHIDVCIGPHPESETVFIVDQKHADTGTFDEHKVLMGYRSREDAVSAYCSGFSDNRGRDRLGPVSRLTIHEFKQWLRDHDTTKAMRGNGHVDRALALCSNMR
jgi:hypothetical protein